jgi:hypothetical protein
MKFDITPTQEEKLRIWQQALETIYGEQGDVEYFFKPVDGDIEVRVYSHSAKAWLNLTETNDE